MKTTIVLLLGSMAAFACGCGSEPAQLRVSEQMLFVDKGLGEQIRIVKQVSDRVSGDLLRIRTQLQNRSNNDLWVDIQVLWKDKDGFELYKTNWAPKHLPPGLVEDYEVVCMRADAVNYEFRIRRPIKNK